MSAPTPAPRSPRSPASGEQRLLEDVLGVLHRPQHPVAVDQQLATVRVGQPGERLGVARLGAGQQMGAEGHRSIPPAASPRAASPVLTPAGTATGRTADAQDAGGPVSIPMSAL